MDGEFFWLDYSQKDIWSDWILRLPYEKRDIYYNPEYIRLYEANGSKACCYVYAKKEDVYIYPFIKDPIPQLPGYFDIYTAYGYGGPVSNSNDLTFLNEAYHCFYKGAIKKNIVAELIKFHPLLRNHAYLMHIFQGNIMRTCCTVYVEINIDEKYRWEKIYTHANRKNINKARRNNLEVKIGHDDKSWEAFSSLYSETMRAKNVDKFYFFSPDYFKYIQKNLPDNHVLVSCSCNGKIVSVLLVLLGNAYAHCHLIGTDREFMAFGVNNLLHHELILWCKNNGYKKLHIGGGRDDNDENLLLRFKKNFSDKISDFYVGESVLNLEIYNELCANWLIKNPGKEISNRLLKYRF